METEFHKPCPIIKGGIINGDTIDDIIDSFLIDIELIVCKYNKNKDIIPLKELKKIIKKYKHSNDNN